MLPEVRQREKPAALNVVVQINVPGDHNVVHIDGCSIAPYAPRRSSNRWLGRTGSRLRLWMWLMWLAHLVAATGHGIAAGAIAAMSLLGWA